ncbi:hypothetical protein REPUB_Repub18cG0021400 [Reevesia pubescens]
MSITSILGDRCILELIDEDHKRVRNALVSFLKPESLKEYVGKMDEEVRKHLEMHWHGKQQVTNEKNEEVIYEKEIIHNVMLIMVVGHDTSYILLTFLVRFLANNLASYASIFQEQEEIAKSKPNGELLRWENLAKMKYTWKVAMETLSISALFL